MRRAVGYIRVSTEEQALSGVSLEDQERKIRMYADLHDMTIGEIFTDAGASGKDLNRDGVRALLKAIRSKSVDTLIITKLDRLTRNMRDLLDLLDLVDKNDIALVSMHETLDTKTATGRFFIRMIGSLAQMEREQISERTLDALKHKKAKGEKLGGRVPYGFDVIAEGFKPDGVTPVKKLVPNEQEQSVIAYVKHRRESGASMDAIADELNAAGHRTRAGGEWKRQYVHRILSAQGEK